MNIHDVYEINGNHYLHLRISPLQKFGDRIKVIDNIQIELNGIHNPIILDSENIAILYGGSCKPKNAKDIFSQDDIDGGLIGGASLDCNSFLSIANSFS